MINVNYFEQDIQRDAAKTFNRKAAQLAYNEDRELQRQRMEENRKKQVDEIAIRSNGELTVTTRNLDIVSANREVCNFRHPAVTRLYADGNKEEHYLLAVQVGEKKVEIFLDGKKAGDAKYLLRRLNSKGCEIYARNRKTQEEYAIKIWVLIKNSSTAACLVPSKYGWNIMEDGTVKFVNEKDVLWEDICRWVK